MPFQSIVCSVCHFIFLPLPSNFLFAVPLFFAEMLACWFPSENIRKGKIQYNYHKSDEGKNYGFLLKWFHSCNIYFHIFYTIFNYIFRVFHIIEPTVLLNANSALETFDNINVSFWPKSICQKSNTIVATGYPIYFSMFTEYHGNVLREHKNHPVCSNWHDFQRTDRIHILKGKLNIASMNA